jgi:hypothetical protein
MLIGMLGGFWWLGGLSVMAEGSLDIGFPPWVLAILATSASLIGILLWCWCTKLSSRASCAIIAEDDEKAKNAKANRIGLHLAVLNSAANLLGISVASAGVLVLQSHKTDLASADVVQAEIRQQQGEVPAVVVTALVGAEESMMVGTAVLGMVILFMMCYGRYHLCDPCSVRMVREGSGWKWREFESGEWEELLKEEEEDDEDEDDEEDEDEESKVIANSSSNNKEQ